MSARAGQGTTDHPGGALAGSPFWRATMPSTASVCVHPLPGRSDVTVVGGGYTGLTAAIFLARAGASVTLLEAETLGWGASTRNGGMFHGGLKLGLGELVRRYGPELGNQLYREGHHAFEVAERLLVDERLECDYRRAGQLVLAWSPNDADQFEQKVTDLAGLGLPAHVVRGSALRAEIGTDYYTTGLVEDMAGGLHPGKYLAELARLAVAAGVDVHEHTRALALERTAAMLLVSTSRGKLRSGNVLVATDGYTDGLLPWVQARTIPIGSYIVVTEPIEPAVASAVSPNGRMFFDTKNFLYYWRLTPDRRLLFGGRASFAPTTVTRTAAILKSAMVRVHPQLSGVRIEYAWGGRVGFTFDRLPHLGTRDGVTYALGYCGSGVCMSTYFGVVAARMLSGGSEQRAERSAFELVVPPGAPVLPALYRGSPWFLPIVGEAYRLKDRIAGRSRLASASGH
jgi:glycine/D-amino acid oxidase-like deaminating enzyme